jgi:uncharacterized lipoprotein YmbA
MMRLMLCLALWLSGCSTPGVRCDSRLQPINPPGASSVSSAGHSVRKVP